MNLSSTKKHHWVILIGIILFAGVIAGGYFLYLQPLNDKLDRKQTELDMANQQLNIAENKTAETGEKTAESTMKLQLLVPVKRQLEQIILDIEKAEIISNVMIEEISMNGTDADELIAAEQESDDANQNQDEPAEEGTAAVNQEDAQAAGGNKEASEETNEENATAEKEPAEIAQVALPEGVNRTTISIKGTVGNYFELEKFIDSLLSLKRIIAIDNLSFKGNEEIKNVDQVKEKTEFELTISAFYYPKLEDLLNELPPIDTPDAANKKNPLNSFSNDTKNE